MRTVAQDRLAYLVVRLVGLFIQLAALMCLTPVKQDGGYSERITAFAVLSAIAWLLNVYCRQTSEYQRRMLTRPPRAERRQGLALSLLATFFAVMSLLYLRFIPTWPVLAISLSLGGCTGYALTNS
jgi:hypothetical protein